jgi:F-type H+-transporting ATPase subunit delta
MNESIIAVRYTKALFELSVQKNKLDIICGNMKNITDLMTEYVELRKFFENPIIKPSRKNNLVKELFIGFETETLSFITLLIENKREEYLEQIARNFQDRYRKHKGIESAVFTTSTPVSGAILESVKKLIKSELKTEVEIYNQVKENIIGGFVLKVGDKQYDASVQTKLAKYKRQLLNSSVN